MNVVFVEETIYKLKIIVTSFWTIETSDDENYEIFSNLSTTTVVFLLLEKVF